MSVCTVWYSAHWLLLLYICSRQYVVLRRISCFGGRQICGLLNGVFCVGKQCFVGVVARWTSMSTCSAMVFLRNSMFSKCFKYRVPSLVQE